MKPASYYTSYDARLGFIASTPMKASKVVVNPVRAVRDDFTNQVSVFFEAFGTDKVPKGVSRSALTIDPTNPYRAIASEDIEVQ